MKLAVRVENALPTALEPLERNAPEPALLMATSSVATVAPSSPWPRVPAMRVPQGAPVIRKTARGFPN